MVDNEWQLSVESYNENKEKQLIELIFYDYEKLVKKPYFLNNEYFLELYQKSKNSDKYSFSGGLTKILSPDGDDYSQNSFYIISGTDQNQLLYAVLLGEVQDVGFKIVAFYPKFLERQIETNPKFLLNLAVLMLKKEEAWSTINVVGPNVK